MRVLVTGADGFVGQHVLAALLDRGHHVIGGIRGTDPELTTLPHERAAAVEWRSFDLRDTGTVDALVAAAAPDALLHLGGLSSVSESWRDPERTFDVNATGALRLLRAVRSLPARSEPRTVLLVGSGEAYGVDGTEARPLREDMPLLPVNPYGASKAAQEAVAFALGRAPGIRLVQTRSFQQVGPGQRPTFVTVDWARQLLRLQCEPRPVLQVGNIDVVRDFLDVRDAAAAYVALLEHEQLNGLYNVCSGTACPLRTLLEMLQHATGVTVEVRVDPDRFRPAEIDSLVGDPARLIQATGWRPRRPLHESLRDLIAFLRRSPPAS